MLGSLTVLPALLSKLGDKVDRLRVPLVGRLRRDDGEGRIWGAIVDRVLRRPVLSALVAGGAACSRSRRLRSSSTSRTPGPDTFPKSLTVVKTYDRMQQAFPGTALPASVVVQAPNVNAPSVRAAIGRFEQRALAQRPDVRADHRRRSTRTPPSRTSPSRSRAREPTPPRTHRSRELRDVIVPETLGTLPNAEAGVTGLTAQWKDQADELKSKTPLVVAFVLLFAFALMLVAFRSLVIAVKAILLNLLSVAAAYGVLVLVFQHGFGKGLLGFSSTAGIDPVVPLLLFVILFGLSMDYHVFIISRIRETYDRGASTDEAIAHGIKSTAGVVTSAAIVMVSVFAIFATLSMLFFKQFGVGLATAVLLDATIVRAVLLPATMKLLGDWNWYLPRWLEWLPRVEHRGVAGRPGGGPDARFGVVPARIPAALRRGRDPLVIAIAAIKRLQPRQRHDEADLRRLGGALCRTSPARRAGSLNHTTTGFSGEVWRAAPECAAR